MKRVGGLFEKMVTFEHLHRAALSACRGKLAKRDVARFYFDLENEIIRIQQDLIGNRYSPKPYTQFEIREPKVRTICCSNFSDRVVHHAVCNLLEPIFESKLVFNTYACRKEKGTHRALRKCQDFVRRSSYFLKCDFRKYFDSIDHTVLKEMLANTIKDERFLRLLSIIIDHRVPGSLPSKGLPIGNLTSQNFANFYLAAFDRHVNFLGFRVFTNVIRIQRTNLNRLRRKVRLLERLYAKGVIAQDQLTESVRSMIGHAMHADSKHIREEIFNRSLKIG